MNKFNQLFKLPTGNQEFLKLLYFHTKPTFVSKRSKKINYTPEDWILESIFNFNNWHVGEFKQKIQEKINFKILPEIDIIKLEKLIKKEVLIDSIPELKNIIDQQGMNIDSFFDHLINYPEPLVVRENYRNNIRIRTRKRDNFLLHQAFQKGFK